MSRPTRMVRVVMSDDVGRAFDAYCQSEGYTNRSEASVALLTMALASTPNSAAVEIAKTEAMNEIRPWLAERIASSLTEITAQLRMYYPSPRN